MSGLVARLGRPWILWIALAAILAAAGAMQAFGPSHPAMVKADNCAGYGYGPGTDQIRLSLDVEPRKIVDGQTVEAFGSLTQNGCPVAAQSVRIYERRLVSGKPYHSFFRVATTVTDDNGLYHATLAPTAAVQVGALSDGAASNWQVVQVHTRITIGVGRAGGCILNISGGTAPTKPDHKIWVQNHTSSGYSTLFTVHTNSHGQYAHSYHARCTTTYHISSYIGVDSTNVNGRSGTVAVKPRH